MQKGLRERLRRRTADAHLAADVNAVVTVNVAKGEGTERHSSSSSSVSHVRIEQRSGSTESERTPNEEDRE